MDYNTTDYSDILTDEERKRLIDSIPRLVDTDACKENIQPRRKGRSVAALQTLFESSSTEREAMLEAGHLKFQEQLSNLDEQDDPLQSYVKYIEWTIQMYPQGQSIESNLFGLLKDATNQFKNDRRYKCDPRYLKIWIEYANLVEEPKEIYLFLIKKNIGQTLSLFYEEYAGYYERLNKFDEATEVYELGIKEKADPIKRLKRSFDLFKARVQERKRRGLVPQPQRQANIQMENLRSTGQRVMLGEKFDSRSRSSFAPNVFAGIESRFGSGGSSSAQPQRHRSFGNDQPSSSTPSAPSFEVYVEPDTPKSSILPSSSSSSSSISPNITPSSSSSSENQRPLEKFAGAIIPQNPALIPKIQYERFDVYMDADEQPGGDVKPKPTLDRSSSMLSVLSTESESQISRIRKNPLSEEYIQNKRSRVSESHKKLETRFKSNQHRFIEMQSSKGRIEYMCMFKDHDQNVSFEELRAQIRSKAAAATTTGLQADEISSYMKKEGKVHKETPTELTAETLAARQTVNQFFHSNTNNTQDEEDLTWNNTYQKFNQIIREQVDENEE